MVQKQFDTSFRDFHFSEYFPNESEIFFLRLARLFGYQDKRKKELTIKHLTNVVLAGKWYAPRQQP